MRKIIYCCDHCGKQLSVDNKGKAHLSIEFGRYSGWVSSYFGWKHGNKPIPSIMQFCNGQCLGRYFNKLKPLEVKFNYEQKQ